MWILPSTISASAPGTAGLMSDSEAFSQAAAPSLLARSKPSQSQTWSRRWKKNGWIRVLSGRICTPSMHDRFVAWWTSYLADSRANRSPMPVSDWLPKTRDTSGLPSSESSESADPQLSFWRTSRGSSVPRSEERRTPRFSSMSWKDWKNWVTGRRQEYSARKKLAHLIDASESSS